MSDNPNQQSVSNYVYPKPQVGYHKSIPTIEVPLPHNKDRKLLITVGILIALPVLLIIVFFALQYAGVGTIAITGGYLSFALLFTGNPTALAVSFIAKKRHIKKVCTMPVRGKFYGYAHRQKGLKGRGTHTVYAPQYTILINNRYEIRTVDRFAPYQYPEDQQELDWLVNPDGYELMPAHRHFRKPVAKEILPAIILLIFIGIIFALAITRT